MPTMTSLADTAAATALDATHTLAELQFELEQSVALSASLASERAALKRQLLDATASSAAHLKRHAGWKEAWKKEREGVLKREKAVARMQVKILEERNELEGCKSKQALDSALSDRSVRLDRLQDIEAEHARKTEALTQEANTWREQSYDFRKKYEELKTQHNHLQSQRVREKDIAEALEKEIAALQHAFAERLESGHGGSATTSASSEQFARGLKLQLEEKDLLLESLHVEMTDLRTSRDAAACSKDGLVASHQAEHEKFILASAKMNSVQHSLERKTEAAKRELSQTIFSKAELEDKLKHSIKELDHARETFGEKEDAYKHEAEQLRRSIQNNESQLRKKLTTTHALLTEEQAKTKSLERRCVETQDRAMKHIAELADDLRMDDSADTLLTAQDQIASLENTCSDLKNELHFAAENQKAEVQRLQHACESCHKDLHLVLLEKNENEKVFAAERAKFQDAEERSHSSVQEHARMSRKIEDLTQERGSRKATSSHEGEVARYKEELSKERRRSAAYKGKAIEAHERSLKAKVVLESLCSPKQQK